MAENKYISELSGNTNPSLTGFTVYDDGSSTYKVSLQTLKDKLFSVSSSYATLSGNTFQGSQTINGNLIVTGSITAQQYVVSSSVYHIVESTISGSSNFGNSLDDTHIFTGSMKISGSITASYFVGDGSQLTNLPLSHLATTSSLNSVSNSVNDLISHTSSYLTSLPAGVISGSSQLPSGIISGSLQIADLGYAITGSNAFFGNQTIRGTVIIGTSSLHSGEPEVLSVSNSGSYNIAYFTGESDTYSQINIQNISDNSGASTDLVLTADNGSETNHYVNLGINSSGWAFQTASIGFQNDGYLYNVGQDMYIGVMDPASSDHGHLHLFSEGLWYQPSISLLESGSVGFNTGSVTTGFTYEFSGSVKLNNELSVSSIKNLNGDLNLSTNGDTVFVIGSNFSVPNGGISSGFNVTAPIISGSSLTGSLDWINLINVPSLISGSSQILEGSNILSGSVSFDGLVSGSEQISYTGITDVPAGLVSGSYQILNGSGIWSGSAQLPSELVSGSSQLTGSFDNRYVLESETGSFLITGSINSNILTLTKGDGSTFDLTLPSGGGGGTIPEGTVSGSSQIIYSGITGIPSGIVSGSSQVLNGSGVWSGSAQLPSGVVSGSSQITYSGITGIPAGLVSGSSQIDHNLTTNYVANRHIDHTSVVISGTTGLSGGGDITTSRNITLDTSSATFTDGVKTKMNTESVVSGSLQIVNYGFATTGGGTIIGNEVISGSLVVTGSVTIVGSITERLVLKIGSGSAAINFDYNSGSIFYLSGSLGNNTFNVQNIPTTANRSTALTFVIEQGATPYSASAYQFDGVGQTIKWSNGATPNGNANKTDVIGLTAFRSGSSWNILGTLSTFG